MKDVKWTKITPYNISISLTGQVNSKEEFEELERKLTNINPAFSSYELHAKVGTNEFDLHLSISGTHKIWQEKDMQHFADNPDEIFTV